MKNILEKLGVKPLTMVAGGLAVAAWVVARMQQRQDIDDAVEKWFDEHVDETDEPSGDI